MKRRRKNENNFRRLGLGFLIVGFLLGVLAGGKAERAKPRLEAPIVAIGTEAKEPEPAQELSEREQIEEFGQEVFGDDWPLFRKIIWCESKFDTKADNGADVGLGQINKVHGIAKKWLKNWKINILIMKQIFDESGLSPWQNSKKCWSKK